MSAKLDFFFLFELHTNTHTHSTMASKVFLKVVSVQGKLGLLGVAVKLWEGEHVSVNCREQVALAGKRTRMLAVTGDPDHCGTGLRLS